MSPLNKGFMALYENHVHFLKNELSRIGTIKKIKRKQIIKLSKPTRKLVILQSGFFSVYRAEDSAFMAYQDSPALFGVSMLFTGYDSIFLRAETDADLIIIDAEKAYQLLKEKNLWEAMTINLVYLLMRATERDKHTFNKTSYQRICSSIREYDKLPTEIKDELSLSNYIINRTTISRTLVMNTLAKLSKEGHIIINRGRLVLLRNPLPDEMS
ncbi:hypothetical protein CU788_15560 [Salmonella enterica]|nr:hypothetical protein [Salmonella enterica]EGW2852198.1 hypothetical protein [Salmonella enterica]